MTSFRQFEANQRNAQRSTGPRTEEGKRRSRCNAVRHGLTAETVIGSLEDAEDYQAFEAAVMADYDGETAVERELVLRLASLLWRLRRATAIETQVFEMQAETLRERRDGVNDTLEPNRSSYCSVHHIPKPALYDAFVRGREDPTEPGFEDPTEPGFEVERERDGSQKSGDDLASVGRKIAQCFIRMSSFENGTFERLNRYEAALWRQTAQTVLTIRSLVPRLYRRVPRT
jgi:hypothetical protein